MDDGDKHNWTGLKGKKVYIETKTGRKYTALVKDVITFEFHYELYLIDKFGKAIMLRNDNIAVWQEERE